MPFLRSQINHGVKLSNQSMVHAHLTLADEDGSAYGGHLMPGTVVFACEIILQALDGPGFERRLDNETGLPLWEME